MTSSRNAPSRSATDGTNTVIVSGIKDGDTVVVSGFDKLGLAQFSSSAKLPGFLTRGPLGTGSSTPAAGAARGGRGG